MESAGEGRIVVGVDGSESALGAVCWAAELAGELGGTVRLVAAVGGESSPPAGWRSLAYENYHDTVAAAAEQHLSAATTAAARVLPEDRIESELRAGFPAETLYEESADASLLVVGSRGRGGFRGLLLGSTAVTLAAAARCPLVVVRGLPTDDGPVVVGADGSPDSAAALGFAFELASRRRAPLLAVRAWAEETNDPAVTLLIDMAAADRQELGELDRDLSNRHDKFPDVEVRTRVVHGPASAALVDATSGARLVVVGSRGRGGLAGLVMGSVSQTLLHHAHCPVAVVREGHAEPAGP